jgi:rod shape-determining protein MreD
MIRILLSLIIVFVLAFLAQLTLPLFVHPSLELLNIPLIALCYFSLRKGPVSGLFIGVVAGFVADTIGGGLFGVSAFSYAVVGFLTGEAGYRFFLTKPPIEGVVVGVAVVVNLIVIKLLSAIFSFGASPLSFSSVFIRFFANGILFACFLLLLAGYRRVKG